jgi:hypothetical protein
MSLRFHRIYHFRPDKPPRDLDTLIAGQLYSSTTDRLNDPFEFIALRALADHPNKLAEYRTAGVTCFCRSITNPLLWSHYAASHRGFAIGLDATHSYFGGDQGIGKRFLLDVRYEDVAPSVERFGIDEISMAAMLTKPTCWAYEQEVRLIKQRGNELVDIPRDMITEVAFGAQMASDRIDEIARALKDARISVELSRMQFLDEGYGVKPIRLTQ